MKLTTEDIYIGGMTCINCQARVQRALEKIEGVDAVSVSYADTAAHITYDDTKVNHKKLGQALQDAGYRLLDKPERLIEGRQFAAIAVIVVTAFLVLSSLGISTATGSFPLAEQGMGLFMLFVIGLFTSVHCIAMCGGINLSQCIPAVTAATGAPSSMSTPSRLSAALPSLSYNVGRLVSYTVVGALVGLLGSALTFSGAFKGAIQLFAGVFMVLMALSMLGILPGLRRFVLQLPPPLARFISGRGTKAGAGKRGPLFVGLLNGLMPCGPLQAMQLYALSTANPLEGALSMFAFAAGTIPLMFALGLLSSVLTERFTKKLMLAGASLVMLLGLFMFSNGWTLSNLPAVPDAATIVQSLHGGGAEGGGDDAGGGTSSSGGGKTSDSTQNVGILEGDVQVVKSTLTTRKYPAIEVTAGIPVRWEIEAPAGSITGCNNSFSVPGLNIEYKFQEGLNIIEFTPEEAGKFPYSCWMGMIRSTITVV